MIGSFVNVINPGIVCPSNPYAFCIVNEVNFANMKKKRHDDAPMTDDAIKQMLTRSHCATSDVTNRGSLPALNVFEILGKALNPILEETKKTKIFRFPRKIHEKSQRHKGKRTKIDISHLRV